MTLPAVYLDIFRYSDKNGTKVKLARRQRE